MLNILQKFRVIASFLSPSRIFGWVGAKLDDMSWGEFIFAVSFVGGVCLLFTGMKMFDYHTQIAALQ